MSIHGPPTRSMKFAINIIYNLNFPFISNFNYRTLVLLFVKQMVPSHKRKVLANFT